MNEHQLMNRLNYTTIRPPILIYVHIYRRVYIQICINMHIHIYNMYKYTYPFIYMYTSSHEWASSHESPQLRYHSPPPILIYVIIYIRVYVHICINKYIHTYTYIYKYQLMNEPQIMNRLNYATIGQPILIYVHIYIYVYMSLKLWIASTTLPFAHPY